jgi:hypothetical protein
VIHGPVLASFLKLAFIIRANSNLKSSPLCIPTDLFFRRNFQILLKDVKLGNMPRRKHQEQRPMIVRPSSSVISGAKTVSGIEDRREYRREVKEEELNSG